MNRLGLCIATCGYVGCVPVAPGTFGSAAGLALLWAVRTVDTTGLETALVVALVAVGLWSSPIAERHAGRVDPGMIVIDEVAGMLITLTLIPLTITAALVGFVVFRALDILKPWPARRLESLPGGWGVMADDVIAAVYGNGALHGLTAVAPGWFT